MRKSLIKDDFEAGPLIPARDQCENICVALDDMLNLGAVDGEMTTTVNQAQDAAMELKGDLRTLIDIATSLADNPVLKIA